jgi:hypothetical protein
MPVEDCRSWFDKLATNGLPYALAQVICAQALRGKAVGLKKAYLSLVSRDGYLDI